jgi:integral membrane protein
VKAALNWYRVLATVVGISIILLIFVAVPLTKLHNLSPSVLPVGSTGYQIGDVIGLYLGTAHGFIYMGFLLVAFTLSRLAKWSIPFTVVTLLCGTIPFLSFWAEFRAIRNVEAQLAAKAGPPQGAGGGATEVRGRSPGGDAPGVSGRSDGAEPTVDGPGSGATKERSRLGGSAPSRRPDA